MWQINKVLISDDIADVCPNILKQNGIEVVMKTKMKKDELIKELSENDYDALLVRSATKVDADVLRAAKTLRLVGRAGTGVDNIDMDMATRLGILVINTPAGNSISAAELTCFMLMALSRNGAHACQSMKEGKWARKDYMGNELMGKTLAVIGLGRIGREVATRMQAFGMKTIGYDPIVSVEAAREFNVTSMALTDIWPQADYITVHVPLIPQTKNLINAQVLSECKKGVRIVNCARGGIINEKDIVDAMNNGKCAGAGFDVFEEEPPIYKPLIDHPKVVCTPHLGASTEEAQTRVAEEIAESIVLMNKGTELRGAINGASVAAMLNPEYARWIECVQHLVRLAQGMSDTMLTHVTIDYPKYLHNCVRAFRTAALVGCMGPHMDEDVNMINAEIYAKDSAIKVECLAVDDTVITIRTCDRVVVGVPSANGVRLIECGQDIRAPILGGVMTVDTSATMNVVGMWHQVVYMYIDSPKSPTQTYNLCGMRMKTIDPSKMAVQADEKHMKCIKFE